MAVYCERDKIKITLPEAYPLAIKNKVLETLPSAVDADFIAAWNTELDALIEKFSGYIDAQVGEGYAYSYNSGLQKFPNVTDSPSTPAVIYEICRLLCLDGALEYHNPTQVVKSSIEIKTYRELAEAELEKIRSGAVKVIVGGATSVWTAARGERTNIMTDTNFSSLGKGAE